MRHTSEDDYLVRISSDRRLEGGQGGDSNGGPTGSSSGAARKLQREDRGEEPVDVRTAQERHNHRRQRWT